MIPRILPILLFLSSLALPAQSNVLVSPRTFAGTMGGSKTYYPFTGSPFVHLQIHDDLGTAPKRINQLAFRAENHPLFKVQAFSAQVTLRLSTAAVASLHADPVFAKNHGPNLATVLNRATVKFPGRASTVNEGVAAGSFT